jgi:hypothetical protein
VDALLARPAGTPVQADGAETVADALVAALG